ncbi:MAG: flavodoxin family protein [Clostridia bacterium]|nr:flavodoxin family protein [Clostridia bacterium]
MKTLIVYFSLNGNTESVVNEIGPAIGADILKVVSEKVYPDKGFKKFLVGGGDVVAKRKPKLEPYSVDLGRYERVIIASPVWASSFVPPIGTFIEENREALKEKRFACIFCNAGGGTEKAIARLKAALGIEAFDAELSLVDPKTRPSDLNSELIEKFKESII